MICCDVLAAREEGSHPVDWSLRPYSNLHVVQTIPRHLPSQAISLQQAASSAIHRREVLRLLRDALPVALACPYNPQLKYPLACGRRARAINKRIPHRKAAFARY